jgi:hypothetical protein
MVLPKTVREVREEYFNVRLTGEDVHALTQRLKKDAIQLECFDDLQECVHLYERVMSQAKQQGFGLPARARDDVERAQGVYFQREPHQ